MLWRRQKRLIVPPKAPTGVWRTHCQLPFLLQLSGSRWRLHFSGRDLTDGEFPFPDDGLHVPAGEY